ncbi:MAG TPA: hypothetical protein VLD55_02805 [Candidatus Sulfobium mesophilum]|nr:hypothetical protein [Candidatus Sulfobium mesophilum]
MAWKMPLRLCMNAYEVIEILKESNLWPPLTKKEKQQIIKHVFRIYKEKSGEIDTHGHARGTFNGTQASLDRLTPESLRFAPGIIHPRACTWNSERVLDLRWIQIFIIHS